MKKIKFLSMFAVLGCLISGCGCNKVNEENYSNAVTTYKNSDAISFSRMEIVSKKGEETYLRKKMSAKYVFDSEGMVSKMQYTRSDGEGSNVGSPTHKKTTSYYFDGSEGYLYTYIKVGETDITRYKEQVNSYESKFDVNGCLDTDKDCALLIANNLAPVFNLNEVSDFEISETGVAKFKAVCPSFEHCTGNSEILEYTVSLNNDGNIGTIEYEIVNGDTTYSIKYVFDAYGSNNVKVVYPDDLESYIKK